MYFGFFGVKCILIFKYFRGFLIKVGGIKLIIVLWLFKNLDFIILEINKRFLR